MKRILCLIIMIGLVFCSFEATAEMDYTLAEKFQNQMKAGSGMSGTVTVSAEGTAPLAVAFQGVKDTEIQIRALRNGLDEHIALFLAGADETREGLTEFLKKEDAWYFRSDLLPEENVWQLPDAFQAADAFLPSREGGNPSFLPALIRIAQMSESRRTLLTEPVVEKLAGWVEVWLADFVGVSQVRKLENGTSGVDLMYSIPMSEIRKEAVELIKALIQDKDGQDLLNAIFTQEQMEVYANEYLDYYYLDAMGAMDNDYDVIYTQTMSTLGQTVASSLELPLDESRMGFQSLAIEDHGGLISFILRGDDRLLAVEMPRELDFSTIDSASMYVYYRPAVAADGKEEDRQTVAARLDLSHESSLTSDEENRVHLRDTWTLTGTHDLSRLPEGEKESDYPETDPLNGTITLHYSSRNAQASPTTLEIDGSVRQGEWLNLGVKAQLKTVAPWVFNAFSADEAREWMSLDETAREMMLAEWLTAAGETMQRMKDATTTEQAPADAAQAQEASAEDAQADSEGAETEASADGAQAETADQEDLSENR